MYIVLVNDFFPQRERNIYLKLLLRFNYITFKKDNDNDFKWFRIDCIFLINCYYSWLDTVSDAIIKTAQNDKVNKFI